MNTRIFLSCLNFKLHDDTFAAIATEAEKLFNHGAFVSSVRLTLEGDYSRNSSVVYMVALVLKLRSSEIIVSEQSETLTTAIQSALEEAGRDLDRRVAKEPKQQELAARHA
jgi:ribosome-associated translation inhibitor RaiA